MSEYTNNYNLILPEQSENYNVDVANTNNRTIDTYLGNKVDKIPGKGLSTNDFTNGYKKKVDALQSLYRFKGNVDTLQELNSKTNNNIGDVWKCLGDNKNYCWNEEEWVDIGNDIDLSDYALQEDLEDGLAEKADNDSVEEEFESIREEIQEIPTIPSGGIAGQILAKKTNTDNDVEWIYNDGGITGDTFPVGAITGFAGTTPPENWLLCDGRAISRTEYARLFNTIGTSYGQGDGFTTFNLPDLRGRVGVGKSSDTEFDTLGETGGEKTHTLTVEEMPEHNHKFNRTADAHNLVYQNGDTPFNDGTGESASAGTTTNTGGGQPHNNLQPYIVTNYIIKATQSAGVVATVVDNLNSTSSTDALSANQGKILNDLIGSVVERQSPDSSTTYTKFSDGTVILRKDVTITTAIDTAWGNWYESSNEMSFGNFPSNLFISKPVVFVQPTGLACWVEALKLTTKDFIGQGCLARPISTASGEYSFSVLAIGKWK